MQHDMRCGGSSTPQFGTDMRQASWFRVERVSVPMAWGRENADRPDRQQGRQSAEAELAEPLCVLVLKRRLT